jgi:histidine triad (HIT) family protein
MSHDPDCLFCKIVRGEIASKKLYEDAEILAIHDIRPVRPVHFLMIPKAHVATLYDVTGEHVQALGKMLAMAGELARREGAVDGFRAIVNCGRVGHQEVYHVHMHVIGGPDPVGPMILRQG